MHGIENLRKVTKDTKRGIESRKSEDINYVLSIYMYGVHGVYTKPGK